MAASSIILFLIASVATALTDSSSEKCISIKNNYFIDTTKENDTRRSILPLVNKKDELNFDGEVLEKILQQRKTARFLLGRSKKRQSIEAWYFPGTSDKKALVIGGVHGSELSGIEVAETLASQGYTVFAGMRDVAGKNAPAAEALRQGAEREQLALHVVEAMHLKSLFAAGGRPSQS